MPTIGVPGQASGSIAQSGEVDRYTVTLAAGDNYTFDVTGGFDFDNPAGNLDTTLTVRGFGQLAFDDDSGPGLDPHINFHAQHDGDYTLEVRGFGVHIGEYSIDIA